MNIATVSAKLLDELIAGVLVGFVPPPFFFSQTLLLLNETSIYKR